MFLRVIICYIIVELLPHRLYNRWHIEYSICFTYLLQEKCMFAGYSLKHINIYFIIIVISSWKCESEYMKIVPFCKLKYCSYFLFFCNYLFIIYQKIMAQNIYWKLQSLPFTFTQVLTINFCSFWSFYVFLFYFI